MNQNNSQNKPLTEVMIFDETECLINLRLRLFINLNATLYGPYLALYAAKCRDVHRQNITLLVQ